MSTAAVKQPFQHLIDAHARAVAGFLRGMLPANDVDDALQETFVAALRAYPSFDGANARGWLLTIARRKAIDERRASSRRPVSLEEPEGLRDADPAESRVDGETLWHAVGALPPKQRAAIVLRYALDLRYREVGEALDCSEAAARRSVHEGIRSLRGSIKSDAEGVVTR